MENDVKKFREREIEKNRELWEKKRRIGGDKQLWNLPRNNFYFNNKHV